MFQDKEYPYLYETHLHTLSGSACAVSTGEQMAEAHKRAGYAGIIITEHNWGGNTAVNRELPWEQFVNQFCEGYEAALRRGKEIGLQVFFGWEAGFMGTEFLIYGLDKEWMLKHPEIQQATPEEQYKMVTADGGMVVHAHPFRKEPYISEIRLFPGCIDAVETINACHSNSGSIHHFGREYNDKAKEYARKYDLPQTAGSDTHDDSFMLGGGMAFSHQLFSIQDYIHAVKTRETYLLTDGENRVIVNQNSGR